jgi:hypothetical protein
MLEWSTRCGILRKQTYELCIEYFFYWVFQYCIGSSHKYDYEPIFLYLREAEGHHPYLIVNGGLGGPDCNFHKIEVRPRSGRRERFAVYFKEKLSPKEYYPFGKSGNVEYKGCSQQYPLNGGRDLQFKGHYPLFGIRVCSNVFSGAKYDLQGIKFNPPLIRLSDKILTPPIEEVIQKIKDFHPEFENVTANNINSFLKAEILTNQTDIDLNSNNW